MKTHALILDTAQGSFSLVQDSETKVNKAFKVWLAKIKKSDWIEVPSNTDLPNALQTGSLVGLRVVEIPPQVRKNLKKLNDPRMQAFLDKADNFASKFEDEDTDTGVDILDGGYK